MEELLNFIFTLKKILIFIADAIGSIFVEVHSKSHVEQEL